MAFLEPIDEAIQLRLFQKMRVLAREENSPNRTVDVDGLTFDKMATRSTFIRMTSGLDNPVVLMGGELTYGTTDSEGFGVGPKSQAAGYEDIYGSRVIERPPGFDFFDDNTNTENRFRRPIAGVKSVEAQFLGGDKALRQATVNWTCWSFEDIDRLTPHFLSVGKTVCVEWGWVYGNKGLQNVRGFIGPNGIRRTAYENNRQVINEAKGDIDMAIGIVKNFEYNSRADGGFDCTTTLSSIGTDFIKKPIPDKGATNMTLRINAKEGETAEDLKKKLESENDDVAPSDVTLKTVVEFLYDFLFEQLIDTEGIGGGRIDSPEVMSRLGKSGDYVKLKNDGVFYKLSSLDSKKKIAWYQNSYLLMLDGNGKEIDGWVRWGWFEDNILSKFETVISDNGIIKSQIRSVDNVLDKQTKKVIGYKSVLIKDHDEFETVNLKKYILPGKLNPLNTAAFDEVLSKGEFDKATLEIFDDFGDDDILYKLAEIVNDEDNFSPFNRVNEDINRFDRGELRNILVNIDVIKQAFGVGVGSRIQSLSTYESLKRMFNILNEDIGFWNFQLQSDDIETFRVKIVDGFTTERPIPENPSRSILNSPLNRSTYLKEFNIVGNNGVFFFPVWQHNSIVKDQNVSCTIPNEIAISVMYGANAPKINTQGATENEANDEGAQAAGGLGKKQGDGGDLKGLQLVYHHGLYDKYGVDSTNYKIQYSPNGLGPQKDQLDVSVKQYFTNEQIKELIDRMPKEQRKERHEQVVTAAAARLNTFLDEQTEKSLPPPLPKHLGEKQIKEILSDNLTGDLFVPKGAKKFFRSDKREFSKLYSAKFDEDMRMKQGFIDNIVYNTTYSTKRVRTKTSELDKPILLPISLELSIDGIGGILPFQSFHSTYLPERYQKEALFQIFSVNHTVDSSQWTTTIGGKMRSTLKNVYKTELKDVEKADIFEQFNSAKKSSDIAQLKDKINKNVNLAELGKNNKPALLKLPDDFYDNKKAAEAYDALIEANTNPGGGGGGGAG